MWVKTYFRHILKCVKTRPLQPVLSVIVLALSFMLFAFAFQTYGWLEDEERLMQAGKYGNAVVTVALSAESKTRFLREEDVFDVLGDDFTVAGIYELPIYILGDTPVFTVAVDFKTIDSVFDFEFISYRKFPAGSADRIAFVSKAFAERYALKVGDALDCDVLGSVNELIVAGISAARFMDDYDMMISLSGVIRSLSVDSPFIAALGDDFKLFSKIYIAPNSPIDKEAEISAANALKGHEAFADKTVSVVGDEIKLQKERDYYSPIVYVSIAMISFLAAAVVFCCFYILSKQRAEQNALFNAVGVRRGTLLFLQCLEIFFYWLPGAMIGTILALAFSPTFLSMCGFTYARFALGPDLFIDLIFTTLVSFGTAALTAVFFAVSEWIGTRKSSKKNGSDAIAAVILSILAVLSAITIVVLLLSPISYHAIIAPIAGVLVLALAFFGTPMVFKAAIGKIVKIIDKIRSRSAKEQRGDIKIALLFSLKNSQTVSSLHNTCRIIVFLLSIPALLSLLLFGSVRHVHQTVEAITGDYVVLNANAEMAENILKEEGVKNVFPMFWNTAEDEYGNGIVVISVKDENALNKSLRPKSLPNGNEAVISDSYARFHGVNIGDKVTFKIDGKPYEFVVNEVIATPFALVYIDSTEFSSLKYNVYSVEKGEGVTAEGLRRSIARSVKLDMGVIMTVEEFSKQTIAYIIVFIRSGLTLFALLLVFSLVGIVDNLLESFRARREEFRLYIDCGMTKKQVRLMKFFEILIAFSFAAIVAAALFWLGYLILELWMQYYIVDLSYFVFG